MNIPPSAREIVRAVCEEYGITEEQITSNRRFQHYVRPRQELMLRLREQTLPNGKPRYTYQRIAEMFYGACPGGAKDHSTVISGIRRAKQHREWERQERELETKLAQAS